MPEPVDRRLLIDLEEPHARRWNGGDAFRWAFVNALSMSFPFGEQHFIDSVRNDLIRADVGSWRACLRPDLHPSQHGGSRSRQWLRDSARQSTVFGQAG